MDGFQNAVKEVARDRDLDQLEGDRTGMANDKGADLDQPCLQARQRPRGDFVGQLGSPQEQAEIVGQRGRLGNRKAFLLLTVIAIGLTNGV